MNLHRKKVNRDSLWLIVILFISLALRLTLLGQKTLWADEGVIWYMVLGQVEHDAPPIFFWLYNWSIQLFGWNEFAGRFPSVLLGWLSIPVFYLITKTYVDRKMALLGAVVAGVSAYLIPLSQEMRIYSIVGSLTALALWIFLKILSDEKAHWGWWIGLTMVGIIGQYSHCFFIFVLGYFGLVFILATGLAGWRRWIKYIALMLIVLILSAPQLSVAITASEGRQHIFITDWPHFLDNIRRMARFFTTFVLGNFHYEFPGTIASVFKSSVLSIIYLSVKIAISLTVVTAGLKAMLSSVRAGDLKALTIKIMLGMILAFTLLYLYVGVSSAGHLVFIYVPFLFLIVFGLTVWRGRIKIVLLALFFSLSGISLVHYYQSPTFAHDRVDWRSVGHILRDQFDEKDALLIFGSRNSYYTLKFYYPELEGKVLYRPRHDPDRLHDTELMQWWNTTSDSEKTASLLEQHRRVWVLGSRTAKLGEIFSVPSLVFESWDVGGGWRLYLFTAMKADDSS